MANSRSRWRFSGRAIVSALALCLFALQALVAGPAPRLSASSRDAQASLIAIGGGYCEPHDDRGAPVPAGKDHSPCCIFCVAGRDGPPLIAADFSTAETGLLSPPALSPALGSTDAPDGRPIGWTSSWSSRAPPAS